MEQEILKLDLSELEAMLFPKIQSINLSNLNLTDLIWGEGGGNAMEKNNSNSGTNLVRPEIVAKIFGFSGIRRVQQLTQDGVIETVDATDENGRKCRRYDLIPTIQSYIQYLSEKAYNKSHRTDKEIELREKKMEADIALRESQNELHRLKTAIASGDYIAIEEVKLDYAKFFVVFKKFAMSLPARVSGMLSGQLNPLEARKVEKEVSNEITDLLNSFVVAGVIKPKDVKGVIYAEEKETLA